MLHTVRLAHSVDSNDENDTFWLLLMYKSTHRQYLTTIQCSDDVLFASLPREASNGFLSHWSQNRGDLLYLGLYGLSDKKRWRFHSDSDVEWKETSFCAWK